MPIAVFSPPPAVRRWLRYAKLSYWLTAASLLSGCMSLSIATSIAPAVTPAPTNTWETLAPGLERRFYSPSGGSLSQLAVLRIDPALYTFRAHYRPGSPLGTYAWRDTLPDASAFINGNFFSRDFQALGMVVTDGVLYGQSYVGRGGTFQIQNGQARVRSNIEEPYYGEPLEQAVQGFPMLVTNGQAAYNNPSDRDVSRRTVIAHDSSGRILLMATPLLGMSLNDLSAYLPTTDMGIVYALNLDGGGSTMMFARWGSNMSYLLPSFDAVPVVLAVYPR